MNPNTERRYDMNGIPGFTAETALHTGWRNYRAKAASDAGVRVGALTTATRKNGKLEWIDCNGFPENNYCRECGNTGALSITCCPDDYCAVIDKTPIEGGKNLTWHGSVGGRLSARSSA
jgi:hypothetical protein